MANIKSLAKDTAIYGLSSIIGRFLNYLLVPVYTAKMTAASGSYGIITNMYALTALILAARVLDSSYRCDVNIVAVFPCSIALPDACQRVPGLCEPSAVCLGNGPYRKY